MPVVKNRLNLKIIQLSGNLDLSVIICNDLFTTELRSAPDRLLNTLSVNVLCFINDVTAVSEHSMPGGFGHVTFYSTMENKL